MGVGDPWDTSYNPKNKTKKNRASGKMSWGPDLSDEYPWDEKEDYKGYGRFCAEGCGCINTGCDNGFTTAQCILPNELTITLVKDKTGRVSARSGLTGRGDVWHLKYSNGAWRGRKCCTSNGDMAVTEDAANRAELSPRLNYGVPDKATGKSKPTSGAKLPHDANAISLGMLVPPLCDPCKVTTLPNGLESTCSYKHNKYPKSQDFEPDESNASKRKASKKQPTLGGWSYDEAIEGKGSWPRQGEELYLTSPEWGANVSIDSITDVDFKIIPAVKDEEGNTVTPAKVVVTDTEETRHGMSKMGFNIISRYGDSSLVAHNEEGDFNGRSGVALADVWEVYTDPRHKYETNYITQCIPDGLTPVRKIPYCQNTLDKKELKGIRNGKTDFCTRDIKYKHEYAHCVKKNTTEATDSRKKACDASDDHTWISIDDIIAECQRGYDSVGGPRSVWLGHQAGCEQRGSCKGFPSGAVIGNIDHYKDCKVNDKDNHFLAHQWVTWEHAPHSCCGGLMIGEDHPTHTPQVSGGGQQTRKNHTCFTPYRELVLSPQVQTGTIAPVTQMGCKAIQNQAERVTFFGDFESYWTVVLRDCGFWNPCFNDEGKANKALYGPNKMGCGEELVLYFPLDQFVNCSNFNLTLKPGENPIMSGWSEVGPRWTDKMGDYHGNAAGFFPGSPEKTGPTDWCGSMDGAGPSTMLNGIANMGGNLNDDNCQQYVYQESGAHFAHIGNPRGHIKLRGLNLRHQPFKATEKIQNSAKAYYQAYNDQKYWEMCINAGGGGGKSFMNMGYEFWFENDFIKWDEVGTTKGASVGHIIPGGVCEDVHKKVRKWVDSHSGGFRSRHCGDAAQGPFWAAWDYSMNPQKGCPECGDFTGEGSCGTSAKCENSNGTVTTVSNNSSGKSACENGGGKFIECCEWSAICTENIIVNLKDQAGADKCRETQGMGDCTCVVDDLQGNIRVSETRKLEDDCKPHHTGGWNDCIWLGDEIDIDSIIDGLDDASEIPDRNVVCQNSNGAYGTHRGEFTPVKALIRPALNQGECEASTDDGGAGGSWSESCGPVASDDERCADSVLVPQGLIDIALDKRLVAPNKVAGYSSGNSMDYWTKTGLYPKGELASFVNNQCVGVGRYSSIQDATNSQPITITSRKHRLREGDKVWPFGIMGNFSANVLTAGDWMETQWESKIYKKCVKNCDTTIWPSSVCPYEADGTCPSKYLGCDGTVVKGKEPPPASFFVIKNVTPDTFDLFTCDDQPIDGRINKFDNMPELERLNCDLGSAECLMGVFEMPVDAQKYELTINGKPWKEATDADIHAAGPYPILTEIPEICVDATSWKEIKKDGKRLSSEDVNNPDVCQVDNPDTDIKDDGPHKKISGGITFVDDPETVGTIEGGGEKVCKRYGQCQSMKDAYGSEDAIYSLTKEDCIELTKTYKEYDPAKGKGSAKATYCIRDDSVCLDDNGNILDADSYEACGTPPVNGNWNEKFTIVDKDENSCQGTEEHGGRHRNLEWKANDLHECVDGSEFGADNANYDNCFHPHTWGESTMGIVGGASSFSNWKVCPHTGDFMIYQQDVGIEAGYVSHLGDQELMDLFVDGWDTTGFKDEDKANHWYAQIEQKGTCPVCCDHFLPHKLTATVTSMPTKWLNLASCGTDPCSPSLSNVIGDGYCCKDGCHACNLGDIPKCEDDPSSYGDCSVEGRKVMVFDKKGCADRKGSFTPVGKSEDCDKWARRRHNTGGLTNCKKCSNVYRDTTPGMGTFEAKLKTGANFPETADLNGGDCCPNCECLVNSQDSTRFGCTGQSYLECSEVVKCIEECDESNVGQVRRIGHVTATCKNYINPDCATAVQDCALLSWDNICSGNDCCEWNDGTGEKCCVARGEEPDCAVLCRDDDLNRLTVNGNAVFDEPTCTGLGGTLRSGANGDDYTTCIGGSIPGSGTGIWVTGTCEVGAPSGTYRWSMDPCHCFPANVPFDCNGDGLLCGDGDASCRQDGKAYGSTGECIDNTAGCRDVDGEWVQTGNPLTSGKRKDGAKEADCLPPNTWYAGGGGCGSRKIAAGMDLGCYDLCGSFQEGGANLNCPGFGSIDLDLEYNGVMWHSDWKLMGTVGTHQCHKYKHEDTCIAGSWACINPTGYISRETLSEVGDCAEWSDPKQYEKCVKAACPKVVKEGVPSKIVESSKIKPARHSDCNGCSHASWDGFSGDVDDPSTGKGDGFYMRGVLGCGSSVPSYEAAGYQFDGGLNVGDYYRNNQMHLFLEITNCSYWDMENTYYDNPNGFPMSGPPIYPDGRKGPGCWSASKVMEEFAAEPITGLRNKYSSAIASSLGARVPGTSPADCVAYDGAVSPCTECCEYRGPTSPANAKAIHGAVLCSTGGDVQHECQSTGFEILPTKPAERFNVVYVKDVQKDGSGTLVVNSHPPTFGGLHCAYPAGTPVSIGMADKFEAETRSNWSWIGGKEKTKNRHSLNPNLPTPATELAKAIPNGNPSHKSQRGLKPYMEIKVKDVSRLISKNQRYNRNLKDLDRAGAGGMDGLQPKDLPGPYGISPWPVDTMVDNRGGTFPGGGPQSPRYVESLAWDALGVSASPGRSGRHQTADLLNKYNEMDEVDMGGGMTTPIPRHDIREIAGIKTYDNVYAEPNGKDGYCLDPAYTYKGAAACVKSGAKWVPDFLFTKITTFQDHDLSDGEKIHISGSIMYKATCKGITLGQCWSAENINILTSYKTERECVQGLCIDLKTNLPAKENGTVITDEMTCSMLGQGGGGGGGGSGGNQSQHPGYEFRPNGIWLNFATDDILDEYLCENILDGEWVIGIRSGGVQDPFNRKPTEIGTGDFEEGCPLGCRVNGFFLKDACEPPSETSPQGKCTECFEVESLSDGKVEKGIKCPYHEIDDMHMSRIRGCQNSLFADKDTCRDHGWDWYDDHHPLLKSNEFALHSELEFDIHDSAQLRTVTKGSGRGQIGFDTLDPDADVYPFQKCSGSKDFTACNNDPDCYFYALDKKGPGESSSGVCVYLKSATVTSLKSVSIADMHKAGIPFYGQDQGQEPNLQKRLCDESSNCAYIMPFDKCLDDTRVAIGECICPNGKSTQTRRSLCQGSCAWIPPTIAVSTPRQCLEANGKIQHEFVCAMDDQGTIKKAQTPRHCQVLGGTAIWDGSPTGIRLPEERTNVHTTPERLYTLSSGEAIKLGGDGFIGIPSNKYRGVIAAGSAKAAATRVKYCFSEEDGSVLDAKDPKECSKLEGTWRDEAFDKYADYMPYWSRHAGAFDIIVGYPEPLDNCAQGNSSTPVNMEFWATFNPKCCNSRGPLTAHQCGKQCYDAYIGPMATSLKQDYGDQVGEAIFRVNIHE